VAKENPKMSGVASVLAVPVIGIAAWIIGGWMIADGMKNKGKLVSRAAGVIGGLAIGLVAFVISLIVMGANDDTTTVSSTPVASSTVNEEKEVKTFDISSDTYIERMNKILSRMEKPLKIQVPMKQLEFSSIGEYQLDKNIKISIMANNGDHRLRGAVISSINDGNTDTSLKILYLAMPAFMAVMNEKESKGVPFLDIITNLMAGKYPGDVYEINGIHYSVVHKDGIDFFFIRPV